MTVGPREPSPEPPAQRLPEPDVHAGAEPEASAGRGARRAPAERTGPETGDPLIAERHRKADDRLLILYRDTSADG